MSHSPENPDFCGPGPSQFAATHWSVVLAAAGEQSTKAGAALEALCRTYWQPLYAYVRRRGHDLHEAQDLTQEFFARLLERGYLRAVDPSKGKFRSFLLAAMEHFLANEWRRQNAQKRGGGASFVSLDETQAEAQHLELATQSLSPEQLFERDWATALLEQVLKRLREEFADAGKAELFDKLKGFLTGDKNTAPYAAVATELGTTEGALKMAVRRLRRRYGEVLRSEIRATVADEAEIEEELRALLAALSR